MVRCFKISAELFKNLFITGQTMKPYKVETGFCTNEQIIQVTLDENNNIVVWVNTSSIEHKIIVCKTIE